MILLLFFLGQKLSWYEPKLKILVCQLPLATFSVKMTCSRPRHILSFHPPNDSMTIGVQQIDSWISFWWFAHRSGSYILVTVNNTRINGALNAVDQPRAGSGDLPGSRGREEEKRDWQGGGSFLIVDCVSIDLAWWIIDWKQQQTEWMTQSCAIERRTDPCYIVSLQLTPPTCPVPITVFSPQPVPTCVESVEVLQPASTDSRISVDLPWELMWSVTGAPCGGFGREALHTHVHKHRQTYLHKHRNIWYLRKHHLKGCLVQKDSTFPHMYHLLHRCGKSRRISDNIWTSTSTRWNRNRNLLRCGARTNERYPSSSRWGWRWGGGGGCYHHPSETPRSWRVQPMAKFNSDWWGDFHTNTQTLETSYDISWYICQKVLLLGT